MEQFIHAVELQSCREIIIQVRILEIAEAKSSVRLPPGNCPRNPSMDNLALE
jgi:hypothetical protein